jgi:hypothetical protein
MRYKESEISLNKFVPKGTEGLVVIEEAKESNNDLKPEIPVIFGKSSHFLIFSRK